MTHSTNRNGYSVNFKLRNLISPTFVLIACCLLAANSEAQENQTGSAEINTEVYKPPVSHFSRLPSFKSVTLSPSGRRIAFTQNYPKPNNLAIVNYLDYATGERKELLQSDNKNIRINWYRWVNEDILLLSASYEMQSRTTQYYSRLLYSIDVSQEEIELKIPLNQRLHDRLGVQNRNSQFQDSVIDFLPNDADSVLIEVDFDKAQQPSVFKVNLRNGRKSRIERGKLKIRSWLTDQQNNVRIGRARDYESGEIIYYERKTQDDDFRKLFTFNAFDDKAIEVLGFGLDPNLLYISKYKGDKLALYKMNLDTLAQELILSHVRHDVSGRLVYSEKSQEAIGIYDIHSSNGIHFFNNKDSKLHKSIDKIFPDNYNSIVSRSHDESIYILYTEADDTPGIYYYGDRNAQSILPFLGTYPELEPVTLPHHEKVTYKARDGVEIEAYLTKPAYGKAPFPTVINPHGGPGARDHNGFDPYVAYINSRGYAVMRPNFRGSSGYGYEFAQAQMGRWGLEMQDDITDAAQYLIEKGVADPSKICIFGASYGGYAATMAAVKTPDLFTCAVSFAGVTDLRRLVRDQRRFVGGELIAEKQIGDDTSDLKARSPFYNVKKIKIPMLIIHGEEDRVVHVKQSREFAEALEDENKDFKYIELEFGNHHLSMQKNRDTFFEALDVFLTQHLGSQVVVVEE